MNRIKDQEVRPLAAEQLDTDTASVRELTADELDTVSGGLSAVFQQDGLFCVWVVNADRSVTMVTNMW